MDRCPCRLHDGRRVVRSDPARTLTPAQNGPPDNKTFDRRRVDPPAGCRAAAEPANLTGRWSDTAAQPKNNRITADRSDVWGRRAVKRFLGWAIHDGSWQVRGPDSRHGPDRAH